MTPRERFHLTMRHGRPDHPPLLEEGLRDDVLAAWGSQGLPPGANLTAMFHYDHRERIEPDLLSRSPLRRFPPTREDLAAFRRGLDADEPSRLPADWARRVGEWRQRSHILELYLHRGLFLSMGVEAWATLEPVLCFLADDPGLARAVMEIQAEFTARMAQRILREVEVDLVSFSEPIADNHGPLISPAMYRQVVLTNHEPLLAALRRHGVSTIVYMTYGNAAVLLPDVLEAEFDCLWAMEVEVKAMDYGRLRERFGRSLRLIGGIDLDALQRGSDAINREIQEKVRPLLSAGGYIPLADGRVRANIPFRNYIHYRRRLEEAVLAQS